MTTFPPNLDQMIRPWMEVGPYASADEVLLDAMLALEDVNKREDDLRHEVRQRVARANSGLSMPLERNAFKAEARKRLAAER